MKFTMRIQKKWFDEIKAGRKHIEYRSVKPYYKSLESPELKEIALHYQGNEMLICEVKKVKIKPKPRIWKSDPDCDHFTDMIYCIYLGKVRHLGPRTNRKRT
jgi:hypothetical protein